MALSIYSNWATPESYQNLDMSPFHEPPSEIAEALAGFCEPFDPSHLLIDSLFDQPNDPLCIEADCKPHPSLFDPTSFSLPHDLHRQYDELDCYPCPKRPRSCSDLYHSPNIMLEASTYFDGPISLPAVMNSNYPCVLPELTATEFVAPPPSLVPALARGNDNEKKVGGGCLSAQSMAARERRKRISEKTQELGRLIPGGNKMNTAEMFQAAYKYVKFLQVQVGILGLVGSIQGYKGLPMVEGGMEGLLTSPTIQEKLYGEGKCMVPKEMVKALAEDQEIKSNHLVSRELDRFIESMG